MMFINPVQLETLKALTLSLAGIKSLSARDCQAISVAVTVKTKLVLSDLALQRLFNVTQSKFQPSFFTLNALSIYCGFEGWEAFCKSQTRRVSSDQETDQDLFYDPLFFALLETSKPTVILKANTPDFTIVTYNKAYEVATHTQKRELRKLTFWEAFNPDHAGESGPATLLKAFSEAVDNQRAVKMKPLQYNITSWMPNGTTLSWWDINIMPVIYDGICQYLLINLENITERILNQEEIEKAILRELTMAEDLATVNVKLNKAIESLAESHEELIKAKQQLERLNKKLEGRVFERTEKLLESETKQRQLIDHAPVAIAVLRGAVHIIETANKKIIDYWGKDANVLNKPLSVALPELEGQPFIAILDEVRRSGIAYRNPELRAFLNVNGLYQARYFDMIYQPIQHHAGITDSIYIVAVDITESVFARIKLEMSEQTLRLAVTAANIGTWSFNPLNEVLHYNFMFAKILGWDSENSMTFEQAIAQATDEFREKIVKLVDKAIEDEQEYNFTYVHKRFNDGQLIWLQAIGRITTDDSDDQTVFSGIIKQVSPWESGRRTD